MASQDLRDRAASYWAGLSRLTTASRKGETLRVSLKVSTIQKPIRQETQVAD